MSSFTLQPGGHNGAAQHAARAHGTIAAPGRAVTPIGSVEWTRAYAVWFSVRLLEVPTYPAALWEWMGRNIRTASFCDVQPHEFVKPVTCKAFTGGIRSELTESAAPGEWCWVSEPVQFVAEWRCYILHGKVATWAQYGEGDDAEPDLAQVADMLAAWPGPAGWALDVGRLADGRQVLVEVNDGWALGLYKGADPAAYLAVIAARWEEIANV